MEKKDIKTLEKYISDYYEKVTADNAQQCMENFDEKRKCYKFIITKYG